MPLLFRIINTVVYVHVLIRKCAQHVASLQGSPVMKSMGLGRLVLYQKGGKLLMDRHSDPGSIYHNPRLNYMVPGPTAKEMTRVE